MCIIILGKKERKKKTLLGSWNVRHSHPKKVLRGVEILRYEIHGFDLGVNGKSGRFVSFV